MLPVCCGGDNDLRQQRGHWLLIAPKTCNNRRNPALTPQSGSVHAAAEFFKNLPDELTQMPSVPLAKRMDHVHLIDEMRKDYGQSPNMLQGCKLVA